MQQRLKDTYNSILEKWNALEKSQRFKIIFATLTIIITLGITIYMITKPKMVTLIDNLSSKQVGEITTALDEEGYMYDISKNGKSILVRESQSTQAEVLLATKNLPADAGSFPFASALELTGMGVTENVTSQIFRQQAQSDLRDRLLQIEGIVDASVILSPLEDNGYFVKSEYEASAAVFLNTSKTFDTNQASAIARFLTRGVKGLKLENIEIVDQKSNSIYSGSKEAAGSGMAAYEEEAQRKRDLDFSIKSSLMPKYDDIKVTLTLRYDNSQVKTIDKVFSSPIADSDAGLIRSQTKEQSSATDISGEGEPGVGANDNAAPAYDIGDAAGAEASSKSSVTDYELNERITETQASTGDWLPDQSAAFIIVYDFVTYDEEYMTENGLLGDRTWVQFKEELPKETKLEIDPDIIAGLAIGTGITNLSMVGYEMPIFVDRVTEPINFYQITMFAILAILILLLAYGLIKKTQPDEITEIEPELSVEDLLVSTQLEDERELEAEKLAEIAMNQDSESKRQIEKFITDRPEVVAQLLRNWLNDDWGD